MRFRIENRRHVRRCFVISAKNGTGIDELTKKIRTVLGVEGFDLKQAVYFTERQKQLLAKDSDCKRQQEDKIMHIL